MILSISKIIFANFGQSARIKQDCIATVKHQIIVQKQINMTVIIAKYHARLKGRF